MTSAQKTRLVLDGEHPTVLMHLASKWCGPCQRFKPQRDELLQQSNLFNVKYGSKIEYRLFEHGKDDTIQKSFGVESFPTILAYSPKTNKFAKYFGEHQAADITKFAFGFHNQTMESPQIWKTLPKFVNM
jgi:thiol-disulfide isomerase/thioredoxin